MLPLAEFQYLSPRSVDEAVALLAEHGDGARLIAGGTDLLPNLKHRLLEPQVLVGLKGIQGLDRIELREGVLHIGAMCTLSALRDSALLQQHIPSLSEAAGQVASPQIQNMGTLGGNVFLDTRCVYYNQTEFWRQSLGFCLKKDGTACHVVKGGRKCVAAHSSDTAPALLSLDAKLLLVSPRGERVLPLNKLYKNPGDDHLRCGRDEILTEIQVPLPPEGVRCGYHKLRVRKSIDFPILGLAASVAIDDAGRCTHFTLVASALGAVPRDLRKVGQPYLGEVLDAAALSAIGEAARKKCVPLDNINVDPIWRRAMVPTMVRRLFARLLPEVDGLP